MHMKELLSAVAHVSSFWSYAAFALAAVLGALKLLLATPAAVTRRGVAAPPLLTQPFIWPLVIVLCVFGTLPILSYTLIRKTEIEATANSIYRVRIMVLDLLGHPAAGATLRTTATSETAMTDQGIGTVTIPRATLPKDGRITIFADLDSAFLHGRTELRLSGDYNPSVTIQLGQALNATVTGLIEDEKGQALEGATVTILGGESGETSVMGTFTLKANAAIGQKVRIHAQKEGYKAVDVEFVAGNAPVTLVLSLVASGTAPATPAAKQAVIAYKKEILKLRDAANIKDPGWEGQVRQRGTELAGLMDTVADRQLDVARFILKHEYRGLAFLMVADTYGEKQVRNNVQSAYAEDAIREFDLTLAKMKQVSEQAKAGSNDAIVVYSWIISDSDDQNRTHYLRAAAVAVAARAGAPHRTRNEALKELQLIEPAYLTTNPPHLGHKGARSVATSRRAPPGRAPTPAHAVSCSGISPRVSRWITARLRRHQPALPDLAKSVAPPGTITAARRIGSCHVRTRPNVLSTGRRAGTIVATEDEGCNKSDKTERHLESVNHPAYPPI
jgi:hypothetical protein